MTPQVQGDAQVWRDAIESVELDELFVAPSMRRVFRLLADGKSREDNAPHTAMKFNDETSFLRVKAPQGCTPFHADWYYWCHQTDLFAVKKSLQQANGNVCGVCRASVVAANGAVDDVKQCGECCHYFHSRCCQGSGGKAANSRGGSSSGSSRPFSPLLSSFLEGDNTWHCPRCAVRPVLGTCWIPLGDIALEDGVLAILPGSSALPNFDQFKASDEVPTSYTAEKGKYVKGLEWYTSAFSAGDLVIFDSQTVHCSSKNYGTKPRLSADFRFYLGPDRQTAKKGDNPHREYVQEQTTPF